MLRIPFFLTLMVYTITHAFYRRFLRFGVSKYLTARDAVGRPTPSIRGDYRAIVRMAFIMLKKGSDGNSDRGECCLEDISRAFDVRHRRRWDAPHRQLSARGDRDLEYLRGRHGHGQRV